MNKICSVILLFFITFYPVFGQDNVFMPLKEILKQVEKQHRVKFNYLDADVGSYKMKPPDKTLPLSEKINYLKKNTALDFEFIDSETISISVSSNREPTVVDTISASEKLSEVVVANYLAKGISKKADGSFAISPKKFGILPGLIEADVLQTMQQIPGIMSVDETITNINVRGGTHDQNLFSWNGIRIFQTGHFFGLISAFNPGLPQEIRIYKNGTSAFFGESVSSTVDISTKSATIEASKSGFGSNLINAEFYTTVKASEKASFTVSGRRSFTDLVESPTYKNYSRRIFQNTIVTNLTSNENVSYANDEEFYFYDFTVQYRRKIGTKNELLLDGIAISNSLDITQRRIETANTLSTASSLKQQNYGGSLSWKTVWDSKNTTHANGYVSYYNLDANNSSIAESQILAQQNTVLDTGIKLDNFHQFNPDFNFRMGYQYNETSIANYDDVNTPVYFRRVRNVLRSHAFVTEAQFSSRDKKAFLTGGLRINYFERFNVLLPEPRLQFNYALAPKLRVEILGELKSQTASQVIDLQQDFLGLEKRRWTLADNDENQIQKSRQVSIGLTFKNKGWLLTFDNFVKKVTGISSTSQSFQNQLEFRKISGDYRVWGSEILVQKNFRKFYTWMSYSFNNNEYTFEGYVPPNFSNNFEIAHIISWAGIYEWKRFKIALGSKWYTGKPETTPVSTTPVFGQIDYNSPNNASLNDYFQVNFSTFYNWDLNPKTSLQFGVSILNLLNKKNTINRYYRVNATNNTIESVNTYSLERTPNVCAKISF